MPRNENKGPVVKEVTRTSYQLSRSSSHKAGTIDFQQNDEGSHSTRQINSPELPFENEGNKEPSTSNIFEGDMGVPFDASDHDYCRVPPRSTESSGKPGIKEAEKFL